MTALLWLASPIGRLVAAGAALLVFLSAFALDQRSRGRQGLITDSKQEAQKINAKNAPVFDRAERPGAADRVLKRYCRDC